MFASYYTIVEITSKWIATFRKDLSCSANAHCNHEKVFTAKYQRSRKRSGKRFQAVSKAKQRNLRKISLNEATSSST